MRFTVSMIGADAYSQPTRGAGQSENLGEGARHHDVVMFFHQPVGRLIVGGIDIFGIGAIQQQQNPVGQMLSQTANFATAQIAAGRVVGIGQIHHAGALGHTAEQGVDRRGEIGVGHGNRRRIVGMGIIGRLGVAVGAVEHFAARAQIRARQAAEQIIRAVADGNAVLLQTETGRNCRPEHAVGLLAVAFEAGSGPAGLLTGVPTGAERTFIGIQPHTNRGQTRRFILCHVRPNARDARFCRRQPHCYTPYAGMCLTAATQTVMPQWPRVDWYISGAV